jgi:hypothetical protein
MRSVGLAFLFFGTLFFLYPLYREWVDFVRLSYFDSRVLGGLMVACGALALAVDQRRATR